LTETSNFGAADLRAVGGRRKSIVEAALAAFVEHGYDNTAMDHIAARAGVSKQTLYNNFDDKQTLFTAVVRYRCATLLGRLESGIQDKRDIRQALTTMGDTFLGVILSGESLAFFRTLIAVTARNPDLGALTYETGAGTAINLLANRLERETQAGRLNVDDPQFAAELFFGMLNGHRQLRRLLGAAPPMSDPEREQVVKRSVDHFLALYAPETERK